MKYEILQLTREHIRDYGFDSYDWAVKHGLSIDHYDKVYEGEIQDGFSDMAVCEMLFEKFNIDRPADFRGHSLSVSDIVVLDGRKYYTDMIGFERMA